MLETTTDDVTGRRALAAIWLVGSTLIAMPAYYLSFVSDLTGDNIAGSMLVVLVMIGILASLVSLHTPRLTRRRVTLVASAMWFISGVLVFGSQGHLLDAMWAGGVPILTGLAAAVALTADTRTGPSGG